MIEKPIINIHSTDGGQTFTAKAPMPGQAGNPEGEQVYTEADISKLREKYTVRKTLYISWLGGWRAVKSIWDDDYRWHHD